MDAKRIVSEFCDARLLSYKWKYKQWSRIFSLFFSSVFSFSSLAKDILFHKVDSSYRFQSHSDSTVEMY